MCSGPATITGVPPAPSGGVRKKGTGGEGASETGGYAPSASHRRTMRESPFRALPSGRADINNRAQSHLLFKARNLPIPAFVRQRHSTSGGFEGAKKPEVTSGAGGVCRHPQRRSTRFGFPVYRTSSGADHDGVRFTMCILRQMRLERRFVSRSRQRRPRIHNRHWRRQRRWR